MDCQVPLGSSYKAMEYALVLWQQIVQFQASSLIAQEVNWHFETGEVPPTPRHAAIPNLTP